MNTLRRHKYAILLAVLLGVILLQSFSRGLPHPILSELAMMTTMVLVFLIVFERRGDRLAAFIALVTAAGTFAAHYVLSGSSPQLLLRVINHSAKLLLIGFATFVILRNIFAQRVVRADDVLGAVCGYLLAAGAFADLFLLIESLLPGIVRRESWVQGRARHLGRAHRHTDQRQPRLADGRRFECSRGVSKTCRIRPGFRLIIRPNRDGRSLERRSQNQVVFGTARLHIGESARASSQDARR